MIGDGRKGFEQGESDETLAGRVALRQRDALAPLYERYAPLVFHIASQSVDSETAEDIVQEVFLSVWNKAGSFDAHRGPFRPWLLQIAHFRILNELRRRSRRPFLDLESAAREAGPPPWRICLVGTPALRVVLLHWPAGYSTVPHRHPVAEEIFQVVRGRAVFTIGDEPEREVGPGEFMLAKRGVRHVIRVAGDAPLQTLVDLRQTRLLRPIMQAKRLVGELSLDEVTVSSPRGTLPPYQEIEAELRPDGSEEDLEAIVAELRDELKLKAEERAKFTRALEAVRKQAAADTDGSHMTEGGSAGRLASRAVAETDRARLEELAAGGGEAARHARALLDLDDGVAQVDVGAQLGITERTVRRWLRAYRRDGVAGVAVVKVISPAIKLSPNVILPVPVML